MAQKAAQSPSLAAGPAATQGNEFRLSDLARVVSERRTLLRNVALGTMLLAALTVLLLPTRYTSAAMVQLDVRRNNVADSTSVLSALPTDAASLQNQIQILTSRDLAGKVIDKLHLQNDPEFAPGAGGGLSDALVSTVSWLTGRQFSPAGDTAQSRRDRDATIDKFLSRESVDVLGLSTTISIGFSASEPEKAARIANAIANAYIAFQMEEKARIANETTAWLYDRIAKLSDQVQAAEAAAQKYKAENNLNDAADGTPLSDQQLSAIDTQIVQARSDLAQKEAVYKRVQDLVSSGHPADIAQVVDSPVIVQLRTQQADLQRQLSDLTSRYGPKNPKLIAAEQQRADLDSKIAQEVDRVTGSIANDVAVARANLGSLEASLKTAEGAAADQNMKRVKLKALQAEAMSTRTMYEAFVTRLRETQDAINTSDAQIISEAPVPLFPSFPQRWLIVGASIPIGLLLGLLAALLAEKFDWPAESGRVRAVAPRQFEPAPAMAAAPRPAADPYRGAPILADVPDAAPVRAASYPIDWPRSAFTHSLASLLQRIVASNDGERLRAVAFTSAQAGEGKTTMAVALARMAAQSGLRVIVLDGNFAKPAAAAMMGLNALPVGLEDVFAGKRPLSRTMFKDPRSGALVLAAARPVPNASQFAAARKTAQLVDHLKRACDLLIIDTPAVLASADARPLLMLADAVVMVSRFNGEPRVTLGHALDALASMGAPPAGIVLARMAV